MERRLDAKRIEAMFHVKDSFGGNGERSLVRVVHTRWSKPKWISGVRGIRVTFFRVYF